MNTSTPINKFSLMKATPPRPSEREFPIKGTLYAFIDEAGDFNWSERGSKYFILTCVITGRPFECMNELDTLKYDLIEKATDVEYFHASNDNKHVRGQVFDILKQYEGDFHVYYVAIKKSTLDKTIEFGDLYCSLFDSLSEMIEDNREFEQCDLAVAITDHLPNEVKKKKYTQELKALMKNHIKKGDYRVAHHRSMSDYGLQVTDYFCWMIQRRLEMGDNLDCYAHPNCLRVGMVYGEVVESK